MIVIIICSLRVSILQRDSLKKVRLLPLLLHQGL